MYEVFDRQTGLVVGSTYKTRKAARRRADKLDLNYGSIRYGCRLVG
jgi:hypothetical protein